MQHQPRPANTFTIQHPSADNANSTNDGGGDDDKKGIGVKQVKRVLGQSGKHTFARWNKKARIWEQVTDKCIRFINIMAHYYKLPYQEDSFFANYYNKRNYYNTVDNIKYPTNTDNRVDELLLLAFCKTKHILDHNTVNMSIPVNDMNQAVRAWCHVTTCHILAYITSLINDHNKIDLIYTPFAVPKTEAYTIVPLKDATAKVVTVMSNATMEGKTFDRVDFISITELKNDKQMGITSRWGVSINRMRELHANGNMRMDDCNIHKSSLLSELMSKDEYTRLVSELYYALRTSSSGGSELINIITPKCCKNVIINILQVLMGDHVCMNTNFNIFVRGKSSYVKKFVSTKHLAIIHDIRETSCNITKIPCISFNLLFKKSYRDYYRNSNYGNVTHIAINRTSVSTFRRASNIHIKTAHDKEPILACEKDIVVAAAVLLWDIILYSHHPNNRTIDKYANINNDNDNDSDG